MPFISVIMSSYNYQNFLPIAIESVLNQTFDDFELIIIDDGSHDRSQEIIRTYAKRDSRILPVFNETNLGISITINKAIQLATGIYFATISSDDRWKPDKLRLQIEVLEKMPDAIVWSEGDIINARREITGNSFTGMIQASERLKSGNIFQELLKSHYIFGSSRIAKTSSLQRFPRNERLLYLNDYLQNIELALHYPFCFIPQPLAEYRIHGLNTAMRDKKGYFSDSLFLCRYLLTTYGHRMTLQDMFHVLLYPVKSYYSLIKT